MRARTRSFETCDRSASIWLPTWRRACSACTPRARAVPISKTSLPTCGQGCGRTVHDVSSSIRCLRSLPSSSHLASADAAQQFLDFLKGEGITVVNTSLMDGLNTDEATTTGISTIADTWIHLSYVVQDGERNRALTIVKSRGTGHSNQVRELTLSDEGVTLTDVFMAQGKALMGVARWEWEQEERAAQERTNSGVGSQATATAGRAGRSGGATSSRPDGNRCAQC